MSSATDPGADYRAAKASVIDARRRQHAAEIAHRHDPTPDNWAAVEAAVAGVRWCQSLVVACGEIVKGEPFDAIVARNAAHGRPEVPR